jgi:predicted permease
MFLHAVYEDVRHALRQIAGTPTLSLAVFLSLALGVGASTSMFGVVDSFIFRPLPIPQTDRVVRITTVNPASSLGQSSYPDFDDLRKRATVFETLATAHDDGAALEIGDAAHSRITLDDVVGGDFFRLMRIQPALGRIFRPEEDEVPDRDPVAMISYRMWQRDFGGKADAIGKKIRVNVTEFTIVGILPESFRGVNPMVQPDFYVPRMMSQVLVDPGVHPLTDRSVRNTNIYGRLKPGVTVEQARAEVAGVAGQIAQENPATNRGQSMAIYTQLGFRLTESPGDLPTALLFLLIGTLVLGIACVNVGNLILSTAPGRTREMAVRLAMGATRVRLVTQFIVESCVISAGATGAGLAIAGLVARFVRSVEIGSGLPIALDMRVDYRVALFAFVVGFGSGILSGLIPALRCSRGDLNQLMRAGDTRVSRSKMGFRQVLVAAEVMLATVVLVISGLGLQSLSLLKKADPGFRVDNVLTMAFGPTMSRGFTVQQSLQFFHQIVERVRKIPGVEAVSMGHHVPLGTESLAVNAVIEGYAMPEGQHALSISSGIVSPGYFEMLRIPVLRGRAFDAHDADGTPKVVVINQVMADKYWPGIDPIGKRIEIQGPYPESGWVEVVGIVRTVKYHGFDEQSVPFMYMPLDQTVETFMYLFVATKGDAMAFIPRVREVVNEIDSTQPIYDIHTVSDTVRRQALWGDRLSAQIASGAGAVSLILGVLGLYGMLAYSVSRRTREIGIRIAVGATSARVFRMIIIDGLKLSGIGIVFGLLLAAILASSLPANMIAPADPQDPLVYGIVVIVLVAITLLSCYYPARRAARVNPNESLRCD